MASDEKYRFHIEDLSAAAWPAELSAAEAHHAMHVLRLAAGAEVELFDGRGRRAAARIASARHGHVSVEPAGAVQSRPRPGPPVHLAFAVPKGKRMDWLLEKATELGAASLRPVVFERSVAGEELSAAKRQRWQTHCIAAAKQCGLDFLPELLEPVELAQLAQAHAGGPAEALALVGDLAESALGLPRALASWRADQPVLIVVGPEGGLTGQERQTLAAAAFVPVRLGQTVLRIETAALALLAAVTAMR